MTTTEEPLFDPRGLVELDARIPKVMLAHLPLAAEAMMLEMSKPTPAAGQEEL